MATRIFEVNQYLCKQCNKLFDAKTEYSKAFQHGKTWIHDIISVEREVPLEEFEARGDELRKKYFAEMKQFQDSLPKISQENLNSIEAVKNGTYVPKTKSFNEERYGSVDI